MLRAVFTRKAHFYEKCTQWSKKWGLVDCRRDNILVSRHFGGRVTGILCACYNVAISTCHTLREESESDCPLPPKSVAAEDPAPFNARRRTRRQVHGYADSTSEASKSDITQAH